MKLFVMVGLPGSGKSYYAKELLKNKEADEIVSSDGLKTKSSNRFVKQPRGVKANCIGEFLTRSG